MADIVILGAGPAGISTANRLARSLSPGSGHHIKLVSASEEHVYQPGFVSVMFGDRSPADLARPVRELVAEDVAFLTGEVSRVDPERRTVSGSFGEIGYDYLVVALGARSGWPEAEPEAVAAPWSMDGATASAEALATAGPGTRIAVGVASMPYRCPPAPFDLSLRLRHDLGAEVTVFHPWPTPLAMLGQGPGALIAGMFADSGVRYEGGFALEGFGDHVVKSRDSRAIEYDLAIVVPPHRPPACLSASGLAGDSGFMAVDYPSLRHPRHSEVFGIGDVVAPELKAGMAGTLGIFEGAFVADAIAAQLGAGPGGPAGDGSAEPGDGPEVGTAPVAAVTGEPRMSAICFMDMGFAGSFVYCDFAPSARGSGAMPECVAMPPMPYFRAAKALFAEQWFSGMLSGHIS
ncbi:MAG: NAD(P)/FAD-dependent oxidoreductase [Acidimicrobiales bacterium]